MESKDQKAITMPASVKALKIWPQLNVARGAPPRLLPLTKTGTVPPLFQPHSLSTYSVLPVGGDNLVGLQAPRQGMIMECGQGAMGPPDWGP